MKSKKLPPEIAVYEPMAREILSWLTDWTHQDVFDRLVREHRIFDKRAMFYTGDTVILGNFMGAGKELDLLQQLLRAGFVEARDAGGMVVYRQIAEVAA